MPKSGKKSRGSSVKISKHAGQGQPLRKVATRLPLHKRIATGKQK